MPPGPGMGGPWGQPPARSSKTGLVVGLIVGGGFIVLLVVAIALAASGVFSGADEKSPKESLTAAANSLTAARGVELNGSMTAGSDQLAGKLKVTKVGRITGDVTWNGQQAKLVLIDNNVFVQSNSTFWRAEGGIAASRIPTADTTDWGRMPSYSLSSSFRTNITPSALARKMQQASVYSIRNKTKTTVQGRSALKITTYSDTYYVSTGDNPKLLRIEMRYPQLSADVTELTGSDTGGAITELRNRVGELKDSFDTSQLPRAQEVEFGSCGTTGCTLRSRVWSTRGSATSVELSVRMWLTAVTKTGRNLGECTTKATIDSIDSEWASCRITDSRWRSYRSGTGSLKWWAHAEAKALGVSESEIQSMLDAIGRE